MLNLVTGGAGFIGAHLVQALIDRGEDVRVLDLKKPHGVNTDAEFIQGSVTDAARVAQAMRGVDAVFHLAANAHIWAADKAVFHTLNVGGTRCILEAAVRAGAAHMVHASSLTVLVGKDTGLKQAVTIDESHSLTAADMLGAYPLSKFNAERLALEAARAGFNTRIAIPTLPVGPGDFGLTPPSTMILDLVNGTTPAIVKCLLNLIDVRDIADGMIRIRDRGRTGERYILGKENMWMRELCMLLHDISGAPVPKRRVPSGMILLAGAVNEWIADHLTHRPPTAPLTGVRLARRIVHFDTTKAATALGFNPRPVETSLADQVNWFHAQGLLKRPLTGRPQLPAA